MGRRRDVPIAGRVVAVTGAARGIGLATATALAGAGARVAIGDLSGDLAAESAAAIGGDAIDPAKVIRKIEYQHPVFTRAGVGAQRRHGEISGRDRTHYCGAYWRWGFHEDGVWSALRACEPLTRNLSPLPAAEPLRIAA